MSGIKRQGLILQDRDRRLLQELGVMRIVDRETAKVVAGFGSTTRANTRLLMLTRGGLLRRFFVGSVAFGRKAVYTLSPKGADLVQAQFPGVQRPAGRLVVGDRFVEHQALVNEIYLAAKYRPAPDPSYRLLRWLSFGREVADGIQLKPDGYFEIQNDGQNRAMFLEVDRGTEPLETWQQKAGCYLQLALTGKFQQRFRQQTFRVLVVCISDRRLLHLRSTVLKQTDKIFWFTTFELIHSQGIWSPVWLRPSGDQRQALL